MTNNHEFLYQRGDVSVSLTAVTIGNATIPTGSISTVTIDRVQQQNFPLTFGVVFLIVGSIGVLTSFSADEKSGMICGLCGSAVLLGVGLLLVRNKRAPDTFIVRLTLHNGISGYSVELPTPLYANQLHTAITKSLPSNRASINFNTVVINESSGRFRVSGVDRDSKMDVTDYINAESAENAKAKAELSGIVVTSVNRA